jgi:hypothetical protein
MAYGMDRNEEKSTLLGDELANNGFYIPASSGVAKVGSARCVECDLLTAALTSSNVQYQRAAAAALTLVQCTVQLAIGV